MVVLVVLIFVVVVVVVVMGGAYRISQKRISCYTIGATFKINTWHCSSYVIN